MAMMSSKAIGDTKDPYNIFKVSYNPAELALLHILMRSFRTQPISPTATPAESVTERITQGIASLFPVDQPQSAPPSKDQDNTEQSSPWISVRPS
jgi:hypothetical protein